MSLSSYELARDATQCAKSDSARPAVMSRCSLTCYPRTIARARCRAFWLVERRCGFDGPGVCASYVPRAFPC